MLLAESTPSHQHKGHSLLAYHSQLHGRLKNFAATDRTQADLIESFPAAVVALAGDGYPMYLRRSGMNAVRAGASLREVAKVLKLPSWARKLPPQAIGARLPASLSELDNPGLGVRLSNAMPDSFPFDHQWLDQVVLAFNCAHGDFAVWLARALDRSVLSNEQIVVLGAYAWCSTEGLNIVRPAPIRPWRPQMSAATAALSCRYWIMYLTLSLGNAERERPPTRVVDGFSFDALLTQNDLVLEGRAMHHCVADYALQVALGSSRIFSISQDGVRVATMEIAVQGDKPHEIAIAQIKGPNNARPSEEVIAAAFAFTEQVRDNPPPSFPARAWREIWRPYWEAKGRRAPLDITPAQSPRVLLSELLDLTE